MNVRPAPFYIPLSRRRLLKSMFVSTAGFTAAGSFAEALAAAPVITPEMTEGPYYPSNTPFNNIPLDKDNDLVLLNDSLTPATGLVTHISGRVLDKNGNPVRGALVELWQADHRGEYLHSTTAERNPAFDPNFAGFGQFLTDSTGAYRFRTIKAGLYRGRTRHLHFGITVPGRERFCTQLYWNEVPKDNEGRPWPTTNENDGVLRGVRDEARRASVIRDFKKVPDGVNGEEFAVWDIVLGLVPEEPSYPNTPGGELILEAAPVEKRPGGKPRWKVTVPVYAGYSYEIYANPTHGNLGWAALPFSLNKDGKPDRNIHTATAEGRLDFYVEKESVKGFYRIGFRLPGANTGTPSFRGFGGPPPRGPQGAPPPPPQ